MCEEKKRCKISEGAISTDVRVAPGAQMLLAPQSAHRRCCSKISGGLPPTVMGAGQQYLQNDRYQIRASFINTAWNEVYKWLHLRPDKYFLDEIHVPVPFRSTSPWCTFQFETNRILHHFLQCFNNAAYMPLWNAGGLMCVVNNWGPAICEVICLAGEMSLPR